MAATPVGKGLQTHTLKRRRSSNGESDEPHDDAGDATEEEVPLPLLFAYLGGVTVDLPGTVVELDSEPRAQNYENESGLDSALEMEK